MIRSYLFVPAIDRNKMGKAINSIADAVIFDLEDAVEVNQKSFAREQLNQFLKGIHSNKSIFVRINSIDDRNYIEDLKMVLENRIDGLVIPKVNNKNDIHVIVDCITSFLVNKDTNIPEIIPILETAKGVQNALEVLLASDLVKKIAFGSVDFALDMELSDPHPLLLDQVRSQLALLSRYAEKEKPIDSVSIDINAPELLRVESEKSKRLGFYGKMAIHPKQLEIINQVYSFTHEEIEEAKEIVERFDEALKYGLAAIKVRGKMIDYPVYNRAKKLIDS